MNEVKSSFEYKGIPTQQVPEVLLVFEDFLKNEKFDNVIEIGTSYGGLSLFLYEKSKELNFSFTTYDISESRVKKFWNDNELPFNYKIEDCFSEKTQSEIISKITNGKNLLLCDGGNKIKEFNLFSKYISVGSYIMAHDYSKDWQYYNENVKNKIWNWCEIRDENLEESFEIVEKSKYYENFSNVVWICCVKK